MNELQLFNWVEKKALLYHTQQAMCNMNNKQVPIVYFKLKIT